MTTRPIRYGIAIRPDGGQFKGCRMAILWSYGFPLLFDHHQEATWYIDKYLHESVCPEIIPEKIATILVAHVVEFFSGRRKISNGNFVVVDEKRPTHAEIMSRKYGDRDIRYRAIDNERMMLYRNNILQRTKPKGWRPGMEE